MRGLMRDDLNNYLELSLDYAQAGLFDEALQLLNIYSENKKNLSPLTFYYRGWFAAHLDMKDEAIQFYQLGARQKPDYCFPNKTEEILILQDVLSSNPSDARAAYYLGNLWYDKRQYKDAIKCWEQSRKNDDSFAGVYRNLSLAYYNKLGKKDPAIEYMQKAFELDPDDARILMELDQLYKISGRSFRERLELLERSMHLVEKRDDLWLERISLYNNTGNYKRQKSCSP